MEETQQLSAAMAPGTMDPMAPATSIGAVSTLKRQLAEEHQRPASLGAGGRKTMWVYLRYGN